MASASVPTTATLVFNDQAFPRLYINGYKYSTLNQPSLLSQRWYCIEYRNTKCPGLVYTSIPLYKLEVRNDSYLHFNHPQRSIPPFSTSCNWILYKYDFSTLSKRESIGNGLVAKGEVSSISKMLELPDMNNMNDDDPLGRFQYCFFQKDISPDWREDLNNELFGGKFILSFREPSEVTRESQHGYWRVLLTCIMQGTFGTLTEYINGAKVHFWGNACSNPPLLSPYISVWTSVHFTPSVPGSSPPILGEMLRKLFEPLVNVQFYRHGENVVFN